MKTINQNNIETIRLGTDFLGSGGGGSAIYAAYIMKSLIENHPAISIIKMKDLPDDAVVAPLAYMGSPMVFQEKIVSIKNTSKIITFIETYINKKITHLIVAEIGGSNAFAPMWYSSYCNIPLVDGDFVGRAFPELSMISTNLFDIKTDTAFVCDSNGNSEVIHYDSFEYLESQARDFSVKSGSTACIIPHILSGKEIKKIAIPNTISQAYTIGNSIQKSLSIKELINKNNNITYIDSGYIHAIDQKIVSGFSVGEIIVKNNTDEYTIILQNEYLALLKKNKIESITPDIIMLLDYESLEPINSELLEWGIRVHIVTMKADQLWYSQKGLTITQKNIKKIIINKGITV
jgi:DUF917 family protein